LLNSKVKSEDSEVLYHAWQLYVGLSINQEELLKLITMIKLFETKVTYKLVQEMKLT